MINGVVFQKNNNQYYRGIEGDNWYLNNSYPNELGEYFENNIEKSWFDPNCVDVCNDYFFIKKYIELSGLNRIDYRILLCETNKPSPQMDDCFSNKIFLGYDYAFSGGCYYSAIYSDICSKRIELFLKFNLNNYGLFSDITDLRKFISYRKKLLSECDNDLLEKGEFIIYKLYEVII